MTTETQPIFSLDKIYIKDVSLEVPNAPQIFLRREQPNVELNISFKTENIDNGIYETVLHAVVTAKVETEVMFLIEIEHAGIFQLRDFPQEQLELLHNIECPNMLFPYLREAISDLVVRSGFLPVILAPINFAFLHQQKNQAAIPAVSDSIN